MRAASIAALIFARTRSLRAYRLDSSARACNAAECSRRTAAVWLTRKRTPAEERMNSSKSFELRNPATGVTSELPVREGTIGPEVIDIANLAKDQGVFTFDPGYSVTASCESKITYIDGDAG